MVARSRAGDHGPDLAGFRAGGFEELVLTRASRVRERSGAAERRLRAVGDAGEGRQEALWSREVDRGHVLIAVFATELQGERREDAGRVVLAAGFQGRIERTAGARAGAAVGAGVDREVGDRFLLGQERVPGSEPGGDRVGPAATGSSEQAALGTEEVHRESLERRLRQVPEGNDQPPGLRIGLHRSGQFHVGGEAGGGQEDAVLVARQRLPQVNRPVDRARQAPSCRPPRSRPWRSPGSWRAARCRKPLRCRCRPSCRRRRSD